jgi:putative ABC transport system ATP-binding protein
VILADEPTGNLDTTMSNQIMELLMQINAAGTTILMVTHNPELAQQAHRQVHIVDGQIDQIHHFNTMKPVSASAQTSSQTSGQAAGKPAGPTAARV